MILRPSQIPVQLQDVHNQGAGFWDSRTDATVVSDPLKPGRYRVTFVSGQPIHATLKVLFEDNNHPPLVMAARS